MLRPRIVLVGVLCAVGTLAGACEPRTASAPVPAPFPVAVSAPVPPASIPQPAAGESQSGWELIRRFDTHLRWAFIAPTVTRGSQCFGRM